MDDTATVPESAPDTPARKPVSYTAIGIIACLTFAAVVVYGWATDFITLEGEWTIYTAECRDGVWAGNRCSGHLHASKRYRFRALKAHEEVLFWTATERSKSGRYENCTILNGRTWTCPPQSDAELTITRQLVNGFPVRAPGETMIPFHQVSKLKWEAAKRGMPLH